MCAHLSNDLQITCFIHGISQDLRCFILRVYYKIDYNRCDIKAHVLLDTLQIWHVTLVIIIGTTVLVPYLQVSNLFEDYHQVSNIRRTLVGNKIVDNSDLVGASPVGATPTTSSFST